MGRDLGSDRRQSCPAVPPTPERWLRHRTPKLRHLDSKARTSIRSMSGYFLLSVGRRSRYRAARVKRRSVTMHFTRTITAVLLGGITVHSAAANGWGGPGHKAVCQIAFLELDRNAPEVKAAVVKILSKESKA